MDFTIEELSMNAWPSINTVLYDGWVIRMANGYGNRSNSINLIYPSRIRLEDKFNYCDELFARHNLLTNYKLTSCGEHKIIDGKLEALNYRKINETSIQVCRIPETAKCNYPGIIVNGDFSDRWKESVIEFNRIEEIHIPTFKKILGNIAVEKIVVYKEIESGIAGCGYGAIENNHVGVFDIVVNERHRGKGYGREIVETIMSEAARRGVENSYLQVMINNPIAMNLYEKLGYREIYRYWYRKKPSG